MYRDAQQLGQISQQGLMQAQQPSSKEADVYDQHRQAVADYQQACRDFARYAQIKENATKAMQDATVNLTKTLQESMQDPTQPQCVPSGATMVKQYVG